MSVVLSEHLPLLASAPDGIQKLRGLILELAVRGKLVPQDPSDEPASELLKRIARERAHLEAKGVVKKSKAAPLVNEDEQPFSLPAGWQWVRLATIGNIFNGNSINSNEKDSKFRRDDGLPYIATKDVGYGLTPLDYENGVRIPESERNFKMARAGAVFICAEGGSAGKKCGLCDRNVFFGNKLFANEAFAGVPPRFVLYIYLSPFFRAQFSAVMTGIIGGVSIAKFVDIPIPLPPLAEQHRIVAKVDELMALCDRLETEQVDAASAHVRLVETLLGTLTQSTDAADVTANWQRLAGHFDSLFTTEASIDALKQTVLQLAVMGRLVPQDPNDEPASQFLKQIADEKARLKSEGIGKKMKSLEVTGNDVKLPSLPLGWTWTSFGQATICRDGERIPVSQDERNLREKLYDYYGASGVIDKIDGFLFDKPLLLIGEDGANLINRSTPIAFIARGKYWVNNHAHVIDGITEAFLRFMELYINATDLKPYVTGTAQPKMNQAKMNGIPIAMPPEEEQNRIVAKVDELMALCDSLKADLGTASLHQATLADTLIESALEAA